MHKQKPGLAERPELCADVVSAAGSGRANCRLKPSRPPPRAALTLSADWVHALGGCRGQRTRLLCLRAPRVSAPAFAAGFPRAPQDAACHRPNYQRRPKGACSALISCTGKPEAEVKVSRPVCSGRGHNLSSGGIMNSASVGSNQQPACAAIHARLTHPSLAATNASHASVHAHQAPGPAASTLRPPPWCWAITRSRRAAGETT